MQTNLQGPLWEICCHVKFWSHPVGGGGPGRGLQQIYLQFDRTAIYAWKGTQIEWEIAKNMQKHAKNMQKHANSRTPGPSK